jgi:molybdopterin-containing oxidoreductase family iron-sulfur binding subunit
MKTDISRGTAPDRRSFIALAGAAAAGALVVRSSTTAHAQGATDGMDALEVMHRDLDRALAKPVEERDWGMVIDTRKCIGCHACEVACIAENTLPPGVAYRRVPELEVGAYPDVQRVFMPSNCFQCDNPPCQGAAPEGAITKRPDGIVEFDYAQLTDPAVVQAVTEACPYKAVSHDEGGAWTDGTPAPQPYETLDAPEYGVEWDRAEGGLPAGAARKCHFCVHRLETGRLPACVTTCLGRAMYFGDFNDPTSTVSRLADSEPGLRVSESLGAQPRILHLADDPATCQACHQ